MLTTKENLAAAIEQKIAEAKQWMKEKNILEPINGMIPCVCRQQYSARKILVGWRFTKVETKIGDIQSTNNSGEYSNLQIIVWVANQNQFPALGHDALCDGYTELARAESEDGN